MQPENILLSGSGQVKVGDFGLGATVSSDAAVHSPVGTPLFSAPEILMPHAYMVIIRFGLHAYLVCMHVCVCVHACACVCLIL